MVLAPTPQTSGSAVNRLRTWDRLTVVALPTAVSCTRAFTKVMLQWWGASHALDDALLVTSELVTNAVQATGLDHAQMRIEVTSEHIIGVQLQMISDSVFVEVWDNCPDPPAISDITEDSEGGRGLRLVSELTESWGTYRPPAGGKIVWAELALSEQDEPFAEWEPRPHRVPENLHVPQGPAREHVETALTQRVLEGLRHR